MGIMLFMLTSFFACTQEAIIDPRSQNDENPEADGEEDPNDDPGKGS